MKPQNLQNFMKIFKQNVSIKFKKNQIIWITLIKNKQHGSLNEICYSIGQ